MAAQSAHPARRCTEHFPGSLKQKGIVTYVIAPNRLDPLAGAWQAAVFNTYRRTKSQIFYWGVPLLIGYCAMDWANQRLVDP